MNYQRFNYRLLFHLVAVILILTGCTEQIQKPTRLCPGKETTIEALSVLRSRSQSVVPLRATGQCRLEYYADGKPKKENFPVRLWLNPPTEVYVQGDVAFDPRGIVLGANQNEFWLAIRLKEISSYWRGRWTQASYVNELMINPRIVLEALGITQVGGDEQDADNWSLSKEGAFDVLTRHNDKAEIIKKIYIYNCDYSVREIQYFDIDGKSELIVQLDKYKQVEGKLFVPSLIKTISCGQSAEDLASVTISLASIKSVSLNEQKRKILFAPPKSKGFKHVFMNVGGKWVEQQQD